MRKFFALPLFAAPAAFSEDLPMLPENVCVYGDKVDHIYYMLLILTGIAAVAVLGSLLYFCIRYRAKKGVKAHYTYGNSWSALGLTGTLALTVFLTIDMNTVRMSNAAARETQKTPDAKDAVHIQVLAQQFSWSFRYPGADGKFGRNDLKKSDSDNLFGLDSSDKDAHDDVVIEGLLCVPVNKPIVLEIRSKDVIHSFFLPNFRIKQDAVPGMKTTIWIQATRTGDFDIACAELCGMLHSQMAARLQVRSEEEFQVWLKKKASDQN